MCGLGLVICINCNLWKRSSLHILSQLYSFNLWTAITLISNYSYRPSCQCLHVRLFTLSGHVCVYTYVGCILRSWWVIGFCRSMAVGRWMAECFATTTPVQALYPLCQAARKGGHIHKFPLTPPLLSIFTTHISLTTLLHTPLIHKHIRAHTHWLSWWIQPVVEFWIRVELVSLQCETD